MAYYPQIKAIMFDVDGSVCPQGGWISPSVASFFRELYYRGIPCGPSTGKNADYCRGIAVGCSRPPWEFILAETGAQLLVCKNPGPPPIFEEKWLIDGSSHLAVFCQIINYNHLDSCFYHEGYEYKFRMELKACVLTLFPPTEDIEVTQEWFEWFSGIIEMEHLKLTLKRHSDGCIDILPRGLDKSLGVKAVCDLYGCKPENILTVGDGVNDKELLEGTTAIVVANATEEIKDLVENQGGFVSELSNGEGFMDGVYFYATKKCFGEHSVSIARLAS